MGQAGDSHDDEPPDDEPDRPRGSPPDPLDRLWRHPTELPPVSPAVPPRRSPSTWLVAVVAGAAGAILTVVALAASGSFDDSSSNVSGPPLANRPETRQAIAADIAQDVGESVVTVIAHSSQGVRRGSGVCVRHEGDILTSARLIGDAKRVDIVTSEGRTQSAEVTGRDPTTDLALLSTESGESDVSAAQLGEEELGHGSSVWIVAAPAIGSSTPWMSGGMVATTDALVASPGGPMTDGLLETDAAANGGASGGALVDVGGSVVGIVLSPVENARTTYVVPIAMAIAVADGIRKNGVASHGSLGVEGVDAPSGPTLTSVHPTGAAALAGLRVNDVITRLEGRRVTSMAEVTAMVQRWRPGRTVMVEFMRGDEALRLEVDLGELNPPASTSTSTAGSGES
jgi:putative serine protease PepD